MRPNVTSPIVVDLGEIREAQIRALRNGAGGLADEVEEVLRLVRRDADADGGSRVFVPIVAIYAPAQGGQDADGDRDEAGPAPAWTPIKRPD